jgi:uncharacterized membrane protein
MMVSNEARPVGCRIFGLLAAVFPANIPIYHNQDIIPAPQLPHPLRLPFQGVFVLWAYWHTIPMKAKPVEQEQE